MKNEEDQTDFYVNIRNGLEFLEATNLDHFIDQSELLEIITQHGVDQDGIPSVRFSNLVHFLTLKLLKEKQLSFDSLINHSFSMPVDRINKFLRMLLQDVLRQKETHKHCEMSNIVSDMQI